MRPAELMAGEVYAGGIGQSYDPATDEPMVLVDEKAWVMEYWLPTRRLRRPVRGESKNGELDKLEAPTAFKGLWVLVGTHQHYCQGLFPTLAAKALAELGDGPGDVPLLGEGITSRVVLHYQLHMPWGDHLVQRAAAA